MAEAFEQEAGYGKIVHTFQETRGRPHRPDRRIGFKNVAQRMDRHLRKTEAWRTLIKLNPGTGRIYTPFSGSGCAYYMNSREKMLHARNH